MSHPLEISLLGPFQIRQSGATADTFDADIARGLFAFLLQHAGKNIRRENLATLLFPDLDDQTALHYLRNALNRVRNSIGDRRADPPYLNITRKSIGINLDSDLQLDTLEFDKHVSFVQDHDHPRLEGCPVCFLHLISAAQMYRGDFLSGFSLPTPLFQEWQQNEIARYGRSAMFVFERLAASYLEQGRFAQAAEIAARQLELQPWEEKAHRQLMIAQALDGNRGAALAQFETCKRILIQELSADPEKATQRLAEQIRQEETAALLPNVPATNLVDRPEPLVGRVTELDELTDLLLQREERLVTLMGPGGMGKTRLAEAVTWRLRRAFPDGVFLIRLAQLEQSDPNSIALWLAAAIGIRLEGREKATLELFNVLEKREALLVLDNVEQLVEDGPESGGVEFIVALLESCAQLTVLLTSRVRLGLHQERSIRLGGLDYTTSDQAPSAESSSARLFAQAAARGPEGFEITAQNRLAINEICTLVAGLPLGIKLAAAWADRLTPAEIVLELTQNLELLATQAPDIPARHRSIRAAFEGSWQRLLESQRRALAQLTVFQGSFNREMAGRVTHVSLDDLFALTNHSLLVRSAQGRYSAHELIRQMASEKLVDQPKLRAETRARHSAVFCDWIGQQVDLLRGPEQVLVRQAIELDFANIRSAWTWAIIQGQADLIALALGGLTSFLLRHNRLLEGRELLEQALEGFEGELPALLEGQMLTLLGTFLRSIGQYEAGRSRLEAGLELLLAEGADPILLSQNYNSLNLAASRMGDLEPARQYAESALEAAQDSGNRWWLAFSLYNLADLLEGFENYDEAIDRLATALLIFEDLGDLRRLAYGYNLMGILNEMQVDLALADARYQQALELAIQLEDDAIQSSVYGNLSDLAMTRGDHDTARRYLQASLHSVAAIKASGDTLSYIYKFALLDAAMDSTGSAAALARFVLIHPATDAFFKQRAKALLAELPDETPRIDLPSDLEALVEHLLTGS
jgi:predicted ATPase/DNA-binding SARP family transcriptional activator